jgi:hypothetical protein
MENITNLPTIQNTVSNTPVVVSVYSSIKSRLSFLGGMIANQKDADKQTVIISSMIHKNDKDQEYSCLRFCTSDFEIFTEVPNLSQFKKPVLPSIVEVNLYDLIAFVNSDLDDSITFFVNGDELIVSSYYSPELDMDQVQVSLKIIRKYENIIDPVAGDVEFAHMDAVDFFIFTRDMNLLGRNKTADLYVNGNILIFTAECTGLYTKVSLDKKDYNFSPVLKHYTVPHRLFSMLGISDRGSSIKMMLRYNRIVVETEEYVFSVPVTEVVAPIEEPPVGSPVGIFTILRKVFAEKMSWFEGMNSPNPSKNIKISKYSDTVAEFVADYEGRYSLSFLVAGAIEFENQFELYLPLFVNLFKDERIDAVKFQLYDDGSIRIDTEIPGMKKNMVYNHSRFDEHN